MREPHAFLMDEPLSNLDAQLRLQTRLELIQLHQRLGITTMYVTHDQVEAMTMGSRIAVMSEGVLQQVGTPQEVYRRPANVFVATFLGAPPMNLIHGALESTPAAGASTVRTSTSRSRPTCSARPSSSTRSRRGGTCGSGCGPEHFRIAAAGEEGGIPGSVQFLEPVGSDLYLTVEAGGTSLQVRTDPDSTLQAGDNVTLHFDPWRVHVFGADGHNLRRDTAAIAIPGVPAPTV